MTSMGPTASGPGATGVWRAWTAGWLGAPALAVVNGAVRDTLYEKRVGDRHAHQISTAGLIALLTPYMWLLQHRRPLPDRPTALRVGALWAGPAVLFEFGLSRARGLLCSQPLHDCDIRKGRVWWLVLLWTALGPETLRGPAARKPADSAPGFRRA